MGVLDYVRARVAARIGTTFQQRLDARVFRANLRRAVLSSERSKPASGLRDVEAVQKLTGSPVLFAVFDMPWAPVFLIAIYSFHPYLGHFALAGMIFLVGVTVLNQLLTRKHEQDATGATMQGDAFAETIRQQGEMIQALGMREAVLARWQKLRTRALEAQLASGDRVGQFSTLTKTFRFFLQSAMLGLGAYVVLLGEMSAGAMIAGSILIGRALAPVEQAIGGWPLVLARPAGLGEPAEAARDHPRAGRADRPAPPARPARGAGADHGAARAQQAEPARPRLHDRARPGARGDRRLRLRQVDARPRHHRRLAALLRRGAARRRGALALRARRARLLHRLPAAGRGAVRRHRRREHRPHGRPSRTPPRSSPPPRRPAPTR